MHSSEHFDFTVTYLSPPKTRKKITLYLVETVRINAVLTKLLDKVVRRIIEKSIEENNDSALSTRTDGYIIKSKGGDYEFRDCSTVCELKNIECYGRKTVQDYIVKKLCKGRVIDILSS